ncbi:MAG TPA: hypothetical protein VMI54_22500 [Polyangiaceae bacterium]|nr:hypothetical protein [Polyangiaceae bacterium]
MNRFVFACNEPYMSLRARSVALALLVMACSRAATTEPTAGVRQMLGGAPTVSAPIAIPATARQAVARFDAEAASPNGFLLVSSFNPDTQHVVAFGTRVALDGTILDPSGFTLGVFATAFDGSSSFAAAYTGARWLVALNGVVVPVDDDGTVETPVTLPSGLGRLAGLSWGGDRALLTTQIGQGLFLDGGGAAIGSVFSIFPSTSSGGAVAFDGSVFFVTETHQQNPATEVLHTVTSGGPVQSTTLFNQSASRAGADDASIVSTGGSVLVTYTATPPTCVGFGSCSPSVVYQQIASASTDGSTLDLGTSWQPSADVLATALGGHYVLWGNQTSEVRDSTGSLVSGPVASPNVATNQSLVPAVDGSELLALTASPAGAQRLDPSLELLDASPFAPLTRPTDGQHPSAAFDGNDYLVAWEGTLVTNVNQAMNAVRLTNSGSLVDATPLTVLSMPSNDPVVSSNGHGFLVGSPATSQVASLDAGGTLTTIDLGPSAFGYGGGLTLASDGGDYLATWSQPNGGGPLPERAALLSNAGVTSGPVDLVRNDPVPATTFDGRNYVLVWTVSDPPNRDVFAERVSPALEPVDTTPQPLFSYPASTSDTAPALASDGERSLLVWLEDDLTTIRCARIEHDLTVSDPGGVVVGTSPTTSPASPRVAWDGSAYWIAWSELGSSATIPQTYGIRARRLDAQLTPLDAQPFSITDDGYWAHVLDDPTFTLTSGPAGKLLLAYTQDDRLVSHAVTIRARLLGSEGQAGAGAGGLGGGGPGAGGSAGSVAGGGVGGSSVGSSGAGGSAGNESADAGSTGEGGAGTAGGNGEGGARETGGEAGERNEAGSNSTGGGAGELTSSGGTGEQGASGGRTASGSGGAATSSGGASMSSGGTSPAGGGVSAAAGTSAAGRSSGGAGNGGGAGRGGHAGASGTPGGGASGGESPPPSASGCGCAVPSSSPTPSAWLACVPLLFGLVRRRRSKRTRGPYKTPMLKWNAPIDSQVRWFFR